MTGRTSRVPALYSDAERTQAGHDALKALAKRGDVAVSASDLVELAEDAGRRSVEATTQDERERWQRMANDYWQQVCDAEEAAS